MPFVLLDVPHTGAHLLSRPLADLYGDQFFDDVKRDRGSFADADEQLVESTLFVRTRARFGLHQKYAGSRAHVFYLTMIRHPVDRLASVYEGIRADPDHVEYPTVSTQSLRQFATGPSTMAIANLQSRTIAGVVLRPGLQIADDKLMARARTNISRHFLYVGTSERFQNMVEFLVSRIGLSMPNPPIAGPTDPDPTLAGLTAEDRAAIEMHHAIDLELWTSISKELDEAHDETQRPTSLVVLQMGKVGSRSIVDAIETATGSEALHVHSTRADLLDQMVEMQRKQGLPIPPHIALSRRLLSLLEQKKPLKVVSLVREPIDRNLSAFFQNLSLEEKLIEDFSDADVDEYVRRFVDTYPHHVPLGWFDKQIKPALGIDVYAQRFDHDLGYAFFERDNIELLVMRAESSDDVKRAAVENCFGIDLGEFANANVSSAKSYGDLYSQFKARVVLSPEYIDEMYNSRYTKHFYTEAEREEFVAKWRSRRADSPQP